MTYPLRSRELNWAEAYPELKKYPPCQDLLPSFEVIAGNYSVRLAKTFEELDEILKLRFEVFNLELQEGLESSFAIERDYDPYDAFCHHLLVWHRPTQQVVGTYRLQTWEMAQKGIGYYTAQEFDCSALPEEVLAASLEVGRVAIARKHRATPVLFLLWKGLARYLEATGKRWLLGPCSIPTVDPAQGWAALRELERRGKVEHRWRIVPKPAFACPDAPSVESASAEGPGSAVELPQLLEIYLRYGGVVGEFPALDRQFKTTDLFVLFDVERLPSKHRKLFFS